MPTGGISSEVELALWDIQEVLIEVNNASISNKAKSMVAADAIIRLAHVLSDEIELFRPNGSKDWRACQQRIRYYFNLSEDEFLQIEDLRHGSGDYESGALAHRFYRINIAVLLGMFSTLVQSINRRRPVTVMPPPPAHLQ